MEKRASYFITAIVLAAAVFLVFSACSMDSGDDLLSQVDHEIAWANAQKLEVILDTPEGWLVSSSVPLSTVITTIDIRKGFPFTLECNLSSAFGFEKWLAFDTDTYNDIMETRGAEIQKGEVDASDLENDVLSSEEVSIEGGKTAMGMPSAKITINTEKTVVIVPWCSSRPRVTQSYPPLLSESTSYPRGQEIRIWFSADLNYENNESVPFGKNFIEITGLDTINTVLLNGHGDLTGLTDAGMSYFEDPVYRDRIITIRPNQANLPPADLIITVTVGTSIRARNNNGMASPVSFYYKTNNLESITAYYANTVWALHPGDAPEKFFSQQASASLDRRIRRNTVTGKHEVTLYFNVTPSTLDLEPDPNALNIAEIEYATLKGEEIRGAGILSRELAITSLTLMENTNNSAGAFYRGANQAADPLRTFYYKAVYTWETAPKPGIIRLVVLPHRTGANKVNPMMWETAVAEGRFVTVVYDNLAPGGNAELTLSGHASVTGDVYNYSNNPGPDNNYPNKTLNIQANFTKVSDNNNDGISYFSATSNKPWTMDENSALQWRYRISPGKMNANDTDGWIPFTTTQQSLDLSAISPGIDANTERRIQLQYMDGLGNLSVWADAGKIKYYTPKTEW